MQMDRFPKNTRSKFTSYIDINHFCDIPNQNIEVAVKSIMYENKISYKDLNMNPGLADMLIMKKFPKEEFSLSNNLQFSPGMSLKPILDNNYTNFKDYEDLVFDLREGKNEIGQAAFTIKGYHSKFYSINILIDDSDKSTHLFQIIFLADQKVKSKFEMEQLLTYIYENNIFIPDLMVKKVLNEVTVLFGEQISFIMEVKNGNPTQRYENILTVFEDGTNDYKKTIEEATRRKFEEKPEITEYILKLLYRKNQQMYTTWNTLQLYTDLNILKQNVLGLRSSIAEYSIRNNRLDKVISIWNANTLKDEVVKIDFKNPAFFRTNKEKLSNARFEIVDLITEKQPYFDVGSPTYIHCIVRPIINVKMKQPFNVLLDSSCIESKKLYPTNTATDFKIKLAERIKFNRNWMVSMQSLFLSNKLFNVSGEKFYIKYKELSDTDKLTKKFNIHYNKPPQISNHSTKWYKIPNRYTLENREIPNFVTTDEENTSNEPKKKIKSQAYKYEKQIEIPAGCYSTLNELVEVINQECEKNVFQISMKVENDRVVLENKDKYTFDILFDISPYLAFTLGFTSELNPESSSIFRVMENVTSSYDAKLSMMRPKYLVVCCDIVDDTIFSGEHVKLLRMLVNNAEGNEEIKGFEFLHHDFVPLSVKEFSTIHVTISDVTGNPILTNSINPTYLQLVFANI